MNLRKWTAAVAVVLVSVSFALHAQAEPRNVRIVTQGFAPLQWDNAGKPDGYVAEYILEVVDRVNKQMPVSVGSFEFLPWKRAILLAESKPDVLFFSLSRTEAREEKFHWLGEVSPYGQYLYRLKSSPDISVERLEDLLDLNLKIGVQDGGNLHTYLQQLQFDDTRHLMPLTDYRQGIEMLYLGRIDLLPLTGFLAEASACMQGYDGSQLEPVVFVEDLAKPLWAVFSKGTDPDLVDAFKTEMAQLKEEGFLEQRTRLHTASWQKRACGG
ncbi:ABC transporter substrate-binding protein [Roseibium sp. SCPC15]|uniref:substrate-binding periplasmic protein n=1 Tax=Roseibium sp. SCP15 TaxID=3141376 RepID=UPI003335CE7F